MDLPLGTTRCVTKMDDTILLLFKVVVNGDEETLIARRISTADVFNGSYEKGSKVFLGAFLF